jgi:hypothetical protein
MPNEAKALRKLPRLMKWRFVPDRKGETGQARYWWSDGSRTEEKVASRWDAVARLTIIQDNGGIRPAG